MKRIIRLFTTALAIALTLPTYAQELRTSYFMENSLFRHQMNPALLEDPYLSILTGNINVGTTGNIGAKDFIYELKDNPDYKYTTFMNPTVNAEEFLNKLHKNNRVDAYVNFNLLSVGFKAFGGTNLIEANLRSNTNVALPYELFEFAKTTGAKEEYDLSRFGGRSQNYLEFALGHAHNIGQKVRIGAKAKFLLGVAFADISANQFKATLNQDKWQIQTDAQMHLGYLGYTPAGMGLAVDLGVTYKPIEHLTLSAGVTDLGMIKWKPLKGTFKKEFTFDGFEDIKVGNSGTGNNIEDEFDQIAGDLEELIEYTDEGEVTLTHNITPTINAGVEYALPTYDKLRFGLLYTGRIDGLYTWHQGMFAANIRPVKWFELSANCAYSNTGFTYGGAISLKAKRFNFYVGADRIISKVSKQFIPLDHTNSSVNVGIAFPL